MFERRPLISLVEQQMGGGTPSRADSLFWGGSIPWASVKDFTDGSLELHETEEHITEAGLRASTSNLIPAGIPLVCTRMAVGRAAVSSFPVAINQDVRAFFPTNDTHPGYLLRLISSLQGRAEGQSVGSTVKGIRTADYLALEVPVAPPEEQSLIAQILDTLDTQIRQTEALIAKLERIKQGLLTDLLTRGIDQNGQLRPPPDQAPHLYKDSPLGRIPKEWEAGSLGTHLIGSPRNGYSPQEAGSFTGRYMLGLGCLTQQGFQPVQLKYAPTNDPLVDKASLDDGDLLITRANTRDLVGLVGVYRDVGYPCSYPDLMMKLNSAPTTTAAFLELILGSSPIRKQVQAAATGTSGSMLKINAAIVKGLGVAMPSQDEQSRILVAVSKVRRRLETETTALRLMQATKQGLMDDLLTGRVRVTPLLAIAQRRED